MVKEWTTYYPGMVDNTTASGMPSLVNESVPGADDGDISRVSQIHAVRDALIQLEVQVGSGATESGSLRWRLSAIEDLPVDAVKIQGLAVSVAPPTASGEALLWNAGSSQWEPGAVGASSDGNATQIQGRDISSSAPTASGQALVWNSAASRWQPGVVEEGSAIKIQGRPVSAVAPSNGQALSWVSATSQWEPATVSGGSGTALKYNEEIWHLYGTEVAGTTQTHTLSVQPVTSTNSVSGYAVEMYREGLRMEPVTTVSGYMGFKYNNALLRVEFKAPGSSDMYQLKYWSST